MWSRVKFRKRSRGVQFAFKQAIDNIFALTYHYEVLYLFKNTVYTQCYGDRQSHHSFRFVPCTVHLTFTMLFMLPPGRFFFFFFFGGKMTASVYSTREVDQPLQNQNKEWGPGSSETNVFTAEAPCKRNWTRQTKNVKKAKLKLR